jgi:hypothetical protein
VSTQDVLDHHLQAFGAGDLEELLKDFTEQSVLIESKGTHRGLSELRAFFAPIFQGLFRPGSYDFTMDRSTVERDVAYAVWHSRNEGADVSLGTDTFVIRDGKISVQTFAAKVDQR